MHAQQKNCSSAKQQKNKLLNTFTEGGMSRNSSPFHFYSSRILWREELFPVRTIAPAFRCARHLRQSGLATMIFVLFDFIK
jgi:hypothetical protein